MTVYITITENFKLPNRALHCRQQFVLLGHKNMIPVYIGNKGVIERHWVGQLCEEDYYEENGVTIETIYIPEKFSVLSEQCIPSNKVIYPDYIQDRDMDKTQDYYSFNKKAYGIDMSKNHSIQRNPEKYDKDLFPFRKNVSRKNKYEDEDSGS